MTNHETITRTENQIAATGYEREKLPLASSVTVTRLDHAAWCGETDSEDRSEEYFGLARKVYQQARKERRNGQ